MKVMLINSPLFEEQCITAEQDLPPFGLAYIATQLELSSCEVVLIDSINENYGIQEILDIIHEQSPEFVGLNIFSANMDIVKKIVEKISVQTNIVIGGRVVEHIYKDIFNWNTENNLICIIGESELIFPALVMNKLEKNFYGNGDNRQIYIVDRKSPFFPRDLDKIILNRKYIKPSGQEDYLVTSRGCIYNCSFCGGAASFNRGGMIRSRTYGSLKEEIIKMIDANKELKSIRILDDLFLSNREKMQISINLFNQFPDLSWRAMAHVIPLLNNSDMLKELKDSGCRELFIGIESGSDKIRKFIRKEGMASDVITAVENVLIKGIDVKGYFIYGFPGENEEDFKKTLKLANLIKKIADDRKVKFRTSVFQYKPYHGTKLYSYIIEHGYDILPFRSNEVTRKGFNNENYSLIAGNFSECSDRIIEMYIRATLELNNEL